MLHVVQYSTQNKISMSTSTAITMALKLTELIEQTFNREGSLYLACNDKNALFLLLNNLNNINCGHVRKCVMRSIIFWTIYL